MGLGWVNGGDIKITWGWEIWRDLKLTWVPFFKKAFKSYVAPNHMTSIFNIGYIMGLYSTGLTLNKLIILMNSSFWFDTINLE